MLVQDSPVQLWPTKRPLLQGRVVRDVVSLPRPVELADDVSAVSRSDQPGLRDHTAGLLANVLDHGGAA